MKRSIVMSTALSTRISRGLAPLFGREPFRTLQEEMDDLIGRFSADWNGEWLRGVMVPSIDVTEGDNTLQVRMDVPGVNPEEINIEVTGNTLRVSGERKEEKEEKGKTYHRVERRSGSFARSLTLPCAVKDDKVSAESHEGVLTITLPKTEESKTHKVKVKSNGK
jgi:HSP20 family protein